jgi:hypothetical protein
MSASPLALGAKKVIDAAWLHGDAYDLSSQAAFALESAQLLQSPETAAELERLRARVAELEAERQSTNESLDIAVRELRTSYAERARREAHPGRRQAWRMLAQVEESERVANALLTPEAPVVERAVCRCGEPDADPYACEAEDCTAEFSELNPFGGGPVEGFDAKVSKVCGCGWRTSVWHVNDGSAEAELHGHVVSVHDGVYPAGVAQ